ncbi:MAG TPA: hypothetical protein VGJ69_01020 [Pyrinomonadaceae bacterium]|jgi:hypothetical protein
MTPDEPIQSVPPRVSILARIIPVLSYLLPALGAAISGLSLINVLRAMRNAESAGIAAVAAGISEANVAVVVSLYLAIIVGFVGVVIGLVRMFTSVTTASPSGWYFLITGFLGLLPMLSLWRAQSILLEVLFSRSVGMVEVAGQITLFSMVALCLGVVLIPILLASAFVPLPSILRAKRKWAPTIALLVMETAIVAMTALYHLRTAWVYSQFRKY